MSVQEELAEILVPDAPATVAAELEQAGEAQWKIIQKNCFTRWTNEQLKKVGKEVVDLEKDLSDGILLIALVEVLSQKRCPKFNKSPKNRTEKLDNVTMTLKFLEEHEGIKIVNIDSSDIVDHNLKLILGLIWTLIQHYSISMPVCVGRPQEQGQTPKQRLLVWIQGKLPNRPVRNFTTDWIDGKSIGALVDGVAPGLCPDWESWNPENNVKNATKAMNTAEQWLDVTQLIQPAEMCNPNIDELSMMTYLSQFPRAKLKFGAPLCPVESPKCVKSCVFVVGFSQGDTLWPPSKDVFKINLNQSAEIVSMSQIPTQMIIESAAAVYRDSVFVTGTGRYATEIWRFDTSFSTWTKCAPLLQRRRRHSVAFVDHILYMCGGYVDEHIGCGVTGALKDVETYDVHKNRCQSVGKLALKVETSGNCVPYKSSLYIFGGNGAQGKVQVYDTKSDTCTLLSSPVPIGNKYHRAVLWESTAILVGAHGSFTYNFETNVWGVRDKLKTGDIYFGLAIADDLVFIIGGGHSQANRWTCRNDVRCVPIVNILKDEPIEWKHLAHLPKPSLVYAFGQMYLEA